MTDPILSVPPGGALSVRDFCRWSSLGRTAVYEEIGRGRLKARKVGRRTIILFEDARRWLETLPTHEEALDAADRRQPSPFVKPSPLQVAARSQQAPQRSQVFVR